MSNELSNSGDTGSEGTEHHQQLQDIFLELTGTEVCVETQDQNESAGRDIAGEEGTTSEYVSTMVQDDGLSETLAEPTDPAPE